MYAHKIELLFLYLFKLKSKQVVICEGRYISYVTSIIVIPGASLVTLIMFAMKIITYFHHIAKN